MERLNRLQDSPQTPNYASSLRMPGSAFKTGTKGSPKTVSFMIEGVGSTSSKKRTLRPDEDEQPDGEAISDPESDADRGLQSPQEGPSEALVQDDSAKVCRTAAASNRHRGMANYVKIKRTKLQDAAEQLHDDTEPGQTSRIFANVVVFVTGHVRPSAREIRRMVVCGGGKFLAYLDDWSEVTHVVATQLAAGKAEEYLVKGKGRARPGKPPVKVVRPEWVVESVRAAKLVSCEPFRLDLPAGAGLFRMPSLAADDEGGKPVGEDSGPAEPAEPDGGLPAIIAEPDIEHADRAGPEPGLDGRLFRPRPPSPNSDPAGFVRAYFANSRLHHLSAWRTALQADVARHQRAYPPVRTREGSRRLVLHADFDAFFASVSTMELRRTGRTVDDNAPIAVAHGAGPTAAVASCNYPARAFGVRNGEFVRSAKAKCADLIVVGYQFDAYDRASRAFYNVILDRLGSRGCAVRAVSVDEVVVDITVLVAGVDESGDAAAASDRESETAAEIADELRTAVREATGCSISVGVGPNRLVARVAVGEAKPDGVKVVTAPDVGALFAPKPVRTLPGVGPTVCRRLEAEFNVRTIADLGMVDRPQLERAFGPAVGTRLAFASRGLDDEPVDSARSDNEDTDGRRTVSAEITWGVRLDSNPSAERFMTQLCAELHTRLVTAQVRCQTLSVRLLRRAEGAPIEPDKRLGHGACVPVSRSASLTTPADGVPVLARAAIGLLRRMMRGGTGVAAADIRGLGVHASGLTTGGGSQSTLPFGRVSPPRPGSRPSTPPAGPAAASDYGSLDIITTPTKVCATEDADVLASVGFFAASPLLPGESAGPGRAGRTPSRLNLSGSQFLLPSQADPAVLAELSEDIRRRLFPAPAASESQSLSVAAAVGEGGRSRPGHRTFDLDADLLFPAASQVDPAVLAALPDDVRAEVISRIESTRSDAASSSGLGIPTRPAPSRVSSGTAGSTRGRSRARGKRVATGPSRPTTSPLAEFIARTAARRANQPGQAGGATVAGATQARRTGDGPESGLELLRAGGVLLPTHNLSDSFLAAIPGELRDEAIQVARILASGDAAHARPLSLDRVSTVAPTGSVFGFDRETEDVVVGPGVACPAVELVTAPSLPAPSDQQSSLSGFPRFQPFHNTPRPDVAMLRTTVQEWLLSCVVPADDTDDEDENGLPFPASTRPKAARRIRPPDRADVAALAKYVRAVVEEERDMAKAVAVAEWLGWCVHQIVGDGEQDGVAVEDEHSGMDGDGDCMSWNEAVERVQHAIRLAVKVRTRRR